MELGNEPVVSPLERRVWEVFSQFDELGDKHVHADDAGIILRGLGCVPTEAEIVSFVKETESEQYPGEILFTKFLDHLTVLLLQKKMKPSPPEELLQVFEHLDEDCKGYLTKEELVKFVTTKGEPFNEEEVQDMLKESVDPLTGYIPYEFYLGKLAYNPPDSIYDLAITSAQGANTRRKTMVK